MNKFAIILMMACLVSAIMSCETKSQENEISEEQLNGEAVHENADSVDPSGLESVRITHKVDCRNSRDTCVLLAKYKGLDICWEQKGYGCHIVTKRNGKEEDMIGIDSWLPYAPQGFEVEDGRWVRFLVGADGHRMSWEEILYLTSGYTDKKITVYGSPYGAEEMKYLETSFPSSVAGYKDSCPVNIKAFILPQTDERELAPHAYMALSSTEAGSSYRPSTFYEAFERSAKDFYSKTLDGQIIGMEEWHCIPVWTDEQSGAVTYLYYSLERPAMGYCFGFFYQTTIPGRDTPLCFDDIFKKDSASIILKLLSNDIKNYAGSEIGEKGSYCFALTRRGVAVTVKGKDHMEDILFQLLPYPEIKEQLVPEVKEIMNLLEK